MRPIRLDVLSDEQIRQLDELYHTTRDVRVRTRAQMVLLAAEQGLVAAEIAPIVRRTRRPCAAGSPAIWPRASTACLMHRARERRQGRQGNTASG
jgi:hypothetical protein